MADVNLDSDESDENMFVELDSDELEKDRTGCESTVCVLPVQGDGTTSSQSDISINTQITESDVVITIVSSSDSTSMICEGVSSSICDHALLGVKMSSDGLGESVTTGHGEDIPMLSQTPIICDGSDDVKSDSVLVVDSEVGSTSVGQSEVISQGEVVFMSDLDVAVISSSSSTVSVCVNEAQSASDSIGDHSLSDTDTFCVEPCEITATCSTSEIGRTKQLQHACVGTRVNSDYMKSVDVSCAKSVNVRNLAGYSGLKFPNIVLTRVDRVPGSLNDINNCLTGQSNINASTSSITSKAGCSFDHVISLSEADKATVAVSSVEKSISVNSAHSTVICDDVELSYTNTLPTTGSMVPVHDLWQTVCSKADSGQNTDLSIAGTDSTCVVTSSAEFISQLSLKDGVDSTISVLDNSCVLDSSVFTAVNSTGICGLYTGNESDHFHVTQSINNTDTLKSLASEDKFCEPGDEYVSLNIGLKRHKIANLPEKTPAKLPKLEATVSSMFTETANDAVAVQACHNTGSNSELPGDQSIKLEENNTDLMSYIDSVRETADVEKVVQNTVAVVSDFKSSEGTEHVMDIELRGNDTDNVVDSQAPSTSVAETGIHWAVSNAAESGLDSLGAGECDGKEIHSALYSDSNDHMVEVNDEVAMFLSGDLQISSSCNEMGGDAKTVIATDYLTDDVLSVVAASDKSVHETVELKGSCDGTAVEGSAEAATTEASVSCLLADKAAMHESDISKSQVVSLSTDSDIIHYPAPVNCSIACDDEILVHMKGSEPEQLDDITVAASSSAVNVFSGICNPPSCEAVGGGDSFKLVPNSESLNIASSGFPAPNRELILPPPPTGTNAGLKMRMRMEASDRGALPSSSTGTEFQKTRSIAVTSRETVSATSCVEWHPTADDKSHDKNVGKNEDTLPSTASDKRPSIELSSKNELQNETESVADEREITPPVDCGDTSANWLSSLMKVEPLLEWKTPPLRESKPSKVEPLLEWKPPPGWKPKSAPGETLESAGGDAKPHMLGKQSANMSFVSDSAATVAPPSLPSVNVPPYVTHDEDMRKPVVDSHPQIVPNVSDVTHDQDMRKPHVAQPVHGPTALLVTSQPSLNFPPTGVQRPTACLGPVISCMPPSVPPDAVLVRTSGGPAMPPGSVPMHVNINQPLQNIGHSPVSEVSQTPLALPTMVPPPALNCKTPAQPVSGPTKTPPPLAVYEQQPPPVVLPQSIVVSSPSQPSVPGMGPPVTLGGPPPRQTGLSGVPGSSPQGPVPVSELPPGTVRVEPVPPPRYDVAVRPPSGPQCFGSPHGPSQHILPPGTEPPPTQWATVPPPQGGPPQGPLSVRPPPHGPPCGGLLPHGPPPQGLPPNGPPQGLPCGRPPPHGPPQGPPCGGPMPQGLPCGGAPPHGPLIHGTPPHVPPRGPPHGPSPHGPPPHGVVPPPQGTPPQGHPPHGPVPPPHVAPPQGPPHGPVLPPHIAPPQGPPPHGPVPPPHGPVPPPHGGPPQAPMPHGLPPHGPPPQGLPPYGPPVHGPPPCELPPMWCGGPAGPPPFTHPYVGFPNPSVSTGWQQPPPMNPDGVNWRPPMDYPPPSGVWWAPVDYSMPQWVPMQGHPGWPYGTPPDPNTGTQPSRLSTGTEVESGNSDIADLEQSAREWADWRQRYTEWYYTYYGCAPPAMPVGTVAITTTITTSSLSTLTSNLAQISLPQSTPSEVSRPAKQNVSKPDASSAFAKFAQKAASNLNVALGMSHNNPPKMKLDESVSVTSNASRTSSATSTKPQNVPAKAENTQSANLLVNNLPSGTKAVDIRALINPCGKVVNCKVGVMKSQKETGGLFALVTMENSNDVSICINKLNQTIFRGHKISVMRVKAN